MDILCSNSINLLLRDMKRMSLRLTFSFINQFFLYCSDPFSYTKVQPLDSKQTVHTVCKCIKKSLYCYAIELFSSHEIAF